jgi:hypothetical protein
MIRKLKILIAHKIRDMAREANPKTRERMRGQLVALQVALRMAQLDRMAKRVAA